MVQTMNVHLVMLLGFVLSVSEIAAFSSLLSRNILAHGTAKATQIPSKAPAVPALCLAANKDQRHEDDSSSTVFLDSTRKSSSLAPDPDSDPATSALDRVRDSTNRFIQKFLAAGGGTDPIGTRGEVYFFVQAALIVAIALGGIPWVLSPALWLVAGPGLLLLGMMILLLTSLDLGESLTPWPKPNGQGLVQDGLYGMVRHPMYTGLLATLTGFSVTTNSIPRLLLTGLLFVAIDIKSDYEEEELKKAYPGEYEEYQNKVTRKFVPILGKDGFWKN